MIIMDLTNMMKKMYGSKYKLAVMKAPVSVAFFLFMRLGLGFGIAHFAFVYFEVN